MKSNNIKNVEELTLKEIHILMDLNLERQNTKVPIFKAVKSLLTIMQGPNANRY